MLKEGSIKLIIAATLTVVVVGLSIGFAVFSDKLNITILESSVTPSGTLDLRFVARQNDTSATNKNITPVLNGVSYASPAIIAGDATTISGLSATFTDKGQSVEYNFYIYNASDYDAYLRMVTFENYSGESKNKICTAIGTTDKALVDKACNDITLMLEIGDDKILSTTDDLFIEPRIGSRDMPVPVKITISYNGTSLLPNGDFKINFGTIKLSYSSLAKADK